MIRRIQALNYRCLQYVDLELAGSFHILVGPNASGKSTLLDVIGFLGDLVSDGLDMAVERRTGNLQDPVWERRQEHLGFELAAEFEIPEALRSKLPDQEHKHDFFRRFRYEVAIRMGDDGLCIASEAGLLKSAWAIHSDQRNPLDDDLIDFRAKRSFPSPKPIPDSVLTDAKDYNCCPCLTEWSDGTDMFNVETVPRRNSL